MVKRFHKPIGIHNGHLFMGVRTDHGHRYKFFTYVAGKIGMNVVRLRPSLLKHC